jgi:predicted DNA-binding transcriptional regulator AlpA
MDEQIVRPAEAFRLTGLRRSAFRDNLVNTGVLTKVRLGRRAVGFLKSEIMAWISERAAEAKLAAKQAKPKSTQPRKSGRYQGRSGAAEA